MSPITTKGAADRKQPTKKEMEQMYGPAAGLAMVVSGQRELVASGYVYRVQGDGGDVGIGRRIDVQAAPPEDSHTSD